MAFKLCRTSVIFDVDDLSGSYSEFKKIGFIVGGTK